MAKDFLKEFEAGQGEPDVAAIRDESKLIAKARLEAKKVVEAEKEAFKTRNEAKRGKAKALNSGPDEKGNLIYSPVFGTVQWKLRGDNEPNTFKAKTNTDKGMEDLYDALIEAIDKSHEFDSQLLKAYKANEAKKKAEKAKADAEKAAVAAGTKTATGAGKGSGSKAAGASASGDTH